MSSSRPRPLSFTPPNEVAGLDLTSGPVGDELTGRGGRAAG
jgi:hypothetical protein